MRRTLVALALAAALAAGCGSRLPDDTLEAIDAATLGEGGGGAGDSGSTALGPGDAGGERAGADGTAGGGGDATAPDGATGAAPGGGAGPAASGDGTAAGAPAASGGTASGAAAPGGARATTAGAPCSPSPATSRGVTPREIKVASIVTDSGPLPGATEGSYRGAASYFAMVNAAGGVCGRKLTLVKGDDGLDPARGRGEFLRLEPQVLGFVGSFAVADSGYIDQIEKTNVPYVGLVVDPNGRDIASVFPHVTDDRVNTAPFVWWKQQHPNVTRAAILYANVGGVSTNVPGFVKAIERAGFQLAMPPTAVGVADPDYTGVVRNLQDRDVEFVYLFAFEVNMHVRFARNMRQQGYDPPIKGANIAFNDRFSKLLGDAGDGWENHIEYLPFLDPAEKNRSPAAATFLAWNNRVFPGGQLDLFAVTGWGRAAFFVEALRAAGGDVDRARLLQALGGLTRYDDGGIGTVLDPKTGVRDRCFVMARHEGGSWRRGHPANGGYECSVGEVFKFK
jgi:ABC-type branched-subunit amino acid transport system substrate-binding protein